MDGEFFKGIANVITGKAVDAQGKEMPLPDSAKDRCEEYRMQLIEEAAEAVLGKQNFTELKLLTNAESARNALKHLDGIVDIQMARLLKRLAGRKITLELDDADRATFYRNGELLGTVNHPDFGQQFVDIWLSPDTTRPELRLSLLGSED